MILPAIEQLFSVQDRDQRIRALTKDLKDIPKLQLRAQTRLEDDEAAVANAKHRITEVELKIKTVELDIGTRRTTITRLRDQQFATRKNEEFAALTHEVKRYEVEVSGLEDKQLEFMEVIEGIKPELVAAQAKLAETKADVAKEVAELAERAKAIEARLIELKAERAALIEPVEPEAVALYERLIKSKGDAAIVPLIGDVCGGCHMKVVLATIQKVKANEVIPQCEQCGRILFREGAV
jgi:predicted  nucleic acid-binding Zn-ribbon protein